jgi:ribonuclease P protein component
VSDRATFGSFSSAPRVRRGAITVRYAPARGDGPPQVAFAIGRNVGGAVQRNRIRRRVRAALAEIAGELDPGGAYLVGASVDAMTLPFASLRDQLSAAAQAAVEAR